MIQEEAKPIDVAVELEGQSLAVLAALERKYGQLGDQAKTTISVNLHDYYENTLACIRAAEARATASPVGLLVKMLNDGDAKRGDIQGVQPSDGSLSYEESAELYRRLGPKPKTAEILLLEQAQRECYLLTEQAEAMLVPQPDW